MFKKNKDVFVLLGNKLNPTLLLKFNLQEGNIVLRKMSITASLFLVVFTTMFVSTCLAYADEGSNSYVISGYVKPDLSASEDIMSGFKVSVDGIADSNGITDKNGYFEFELKPSAAQKYKLLISKDGYLAREITDFEISSNISIGTIDEPVEIWAGDLNQDSMINMSDVMAIAKTFNVTSSDERFVQSYDFNLDSSINMAEVLVIAKHFNAIPANYPKVNVKGQISEYVQVVAGGDRTIGVKSDGTVWNGLGMQSKIEGLSNIKSVFLIDNNDILALTKDEGRIIRGYSYDKDSWKEYTDLKHVKKIIGSQYEQTIILTEEGVVYTKGYAWSDDLVEVKLGARKAIDIAQGRGHSLVVMEDGTVYGFGLNDYGQLGIPKGEKVSGPVNLSAVIPNLTNVKAVAAFQDRSYALKNDGSIWSWGKYDSSLGIGESSTEIIQPTQVIDDSRIKTMSIAASEHSLQTIKEDGSVWNCGDNIYYSLGIGDSRHITSYKLIKNPVVNNVKNISAGNKHVVVQKNDGSFWGWSNNGVLGFDNYPESPSISRYSYFGRFMTGFENKDTKVEINRTLTTSNVKPDFYIGLEGYLTSGNNLKVYGILGYKEFFSYKTSLEETIRLEIYKDKYLITGPGSGAVSRKIVGGSIPDRDLNMKIIAEVPNIEDNKNLKLNLDVINMSNHKLSINMNDVGNRVTVKNYNDEIDYGIHKYLYNPKSTTLTCSVPSDKKTAMIDVDYRFAGLTYDVTQAGNLPGKAQIKVKENESVVKEYDVNFLEPSNKYYSSTDGSIDYGGEFSLYYLDMEKDKTYNIYSTGNTDTLLEIRDEKFDLVGSNNDSGEGSNFNLSFMPKETKTYTLLVKHIDQISGTGKYNICVEEAFDSDVTTTNKTTEGIDWSVKNAKSRFLSIYDDNNILVSEMDFSNNEGTLTSTGLKSDITYKAVLKDANGEVVLIQYAKTKGVE